MWYYEEDSRSGLRSPAEESNSGRNGRVTDPLVDDQVVRDLRDDTRSRGPSTNGQLSGFSDINSDARADRNWRSTASDDPHVDLGPQWIPKTDSGESDSMGGSARRRNDADNSSSTTSFGRPVYDVASSTGLAPRVHSNSDVDDDLSALTFHMDPVGPAHDARKPSALRSSSGPAVEPSVPSSSAAQPFVVVLPAANSFNLSVNMPSVEERTRAFSSFVSFLSAHTCYDMIPASGKILVLDIKVPVRSAFLALCEHSMKSASLLDGEKLVGMLDVTDFIKIILHHHVGLRPGLSDDALLRDLSRSIKEWKTLIDAKAVAHAEVYRSSRPEDNLLLVAARILKYKLRRMPVVDPDTGDVLHMVTFSRVLRFMIVNLKKLDAPLFDRSIYELGVGTYENITMAFAETPFIQMLELLDRRQLAAVPIVDERGRLIAKFVKSDIKAVASHRMFRNLNRPVREVYLDVVGRDQVFTFHKTTRLRDILNMFANTRVYTLICVDRDGAVNGVVTIVDVFAYLLEHVLKDTLQNEPSSI